MAVLGVNITEISIMELTCINLRYNFEVEYYLSLVNSTINNKKNPWRYILFSIVINHFDFHSMQISSFICQSKYSCCQSTNTGHQWRNSPSQCNNFGHQWRNSSCQCNNTGHHWSNSPSQCNNSGHHWRNSPYQCNNTGHHWRNSGYQWHNTASQWHNSAYHLELTPSHSEILFGFQIASDDILGTLSANRFLHINF